MRRTSSTEWPPPDPEGGASSASPDSTARFTDRAASYDLGRPGYPDALFARLAEEGVFRSGMVVADVGSGTGVLSRALLERGCRVCGVEPNAAMRARAARALAHQTGFTSVDGTAEDTGLPGQTADLVTAAQAFHWFRPAEAARELGRVLKPDGRALVVWNHRRVRGAPFPEAYEAFLHTWGTDYARVAPTHADPRALAAFFSGGAYRRARVPNVQTLDLGGLRARVTSSSYVPGPAHPRRAAMMRALDDLFSEHQDEGSVNLTYDTLAFWGRL